MWNIALAVPQPIPTVEAPMALNSTMNMVGTLVSMIQWIGYALGIVGFIVAIIFFIKSILDIKKLNQEVSEETIKSIKVTSIVLLVLNILTFCSNFIMAILAVVSTVFVSKANKLLASDMELAKSKAQTANTLNIVIAALMLISPIIMVFVVSVLDIILNNMA